MAQVIFYERPECVNNAKQKALLWASGHEVTAYNLFETPWTVDTLRPFFGDRPIAEWFNKTAPQIKLGEIVPEDLDETAALELMIKDPTLIRRPLIQVGDTYQIGFNRAQVDAWIGLASPKGFEKLETCPRTH
ncbi:MAG: ArsC/Spx/MgsR family protein [Pleurocapsa sp. MO_192.B19]|nr:ArsC/Spx/MgsR family protein [Pleurocapsa sp. MO_192.B19]